MEKNVKWSPWNWSSDKNHWTYPELKFSEIDQVKSTENNLQASAFAIIKISRQVYKAHVIFMKHLLK